MNHTWALNRRTEEFVELKDINSFNPWGAICKLCTAITKRWYRFFRAFPRESKRETRVLFAAFSLAGVSGSIAQGVRFLIPYVL